MPRVPGSCVRCPKLLVIFSSSARMCTSVARGFRDANVLSLAMQRASGLAQGACIDVVELCHVSDYWIREYRDTSKLGTRRYDEPSFRNGLGPLPSAVPGLLVLTPALPYAVKTILPSARPPSACHGTICSASHRPPPTVGVAPASCPGSWSAWSSRLVGWSLERSFSEDSWRPLHPVSPRTVRSSKGREDVDTQAQAFATSLRT